MSTTGIILAAGSGERFKSDLPKQFLKVAGKAVIDHTVEVFEGSELIDDIVITCSAEHVQPIREHVLSRGWKKVAGVLIGGATRQESTRIALGACPEGTETVLVHDGVRPLVTDAIIEGVIRGLDRYPAVDTVIPTADTIVRSDPDGQLIDEIPERSCLWRGQTPQGFRYAVIRQAHDRAEQEGYNGAPDDCSLILRYQLGQVGLVPGHETNIKITTPIDIYLVDRLFQLRASSLPATSFDALKERLEGRVLVIFGGAKGIGASLGNLASRLGMQVCSYGSERDVRDYRLVEETLQEVLQKHGRIDHVVNSAGVLSMLYIEHADIEDIRAQIEINLVGAIRVCKAAAGVMKEHGGHIVLFTSSSHTRGRAGYTPYSAAKAGLVNFVQGFSEEVIQYGIRVNAVNPERTRTPMRVSNFGKEDERTLLKPETVAIQSLNLMAGSITGMVVDVTKSEEDVILSSFGERRLSG